MATESITNELLTPAEAIVYLGLDRDGSRDPAERLRNLIRHQGLPCCKNGKFRRFRRSAIDAWLDGDRRGGRIKSLARKVGT